MSLKRLDLEDITISVEAVTTSAWSGNVPELTTFFTGSAQVDSTSGNFYYEVSNLAVSNPSSEVQFSIAYGNVSGSGADPFTTSVPQNTPTSVIYKQYRNLTLGTEEGLIQFNGVDSEEVLVINVERSRYKEKLLPGSLEIEIDSAVYVDNSDTQTTQRFSDAGREFSIVEQGETTEVGKFYPDIGVILLSPSVLSGTPTFVQKLDRLFTNIKDGGSFKLRSEETLSSNIGFIRARNAEFNYTTNPSIINEDGEIRDSVLINSPQTFITTVGLYNDRNDLLAVAKLSRPLLKDFNKEALLRIKLDF